MNQAKRFVAFMSATVILIASISFVMYLAEYTHHDCTEVECAVCRKLEIVQETLNNILLLFMPGTIAIYCGILYRVIGNVCDSAHIKNTLIMLKVELLN